MVLVGDMDTLRSWSCKKNGDHVRSSAGLAGLL
jgi:hypothetical protein